MVYSDIPEEIYRSVRPFNITPFEITVNPSLVATANRFFTEEHTKATYVLTKPLPQATQFLAPYLNPVYWENGNSQDLVNVLVVLSQKYDPAYRAWQIVRKVRAPEIVGNALPPTGLEGLYVGLGWSSDRIAVDLSLTADRMLTSLKRLYPSAGLNFNKLTQVLQGTRQDPAAFITIMEQFGMELHRKKQELAHLREYSSKASTEYADFRYDTYQYVNKLPPVEYDQTEPNHFAQKYPLPSPAVSNGTVNGVSEKLRFLELVGVAGQPLLRAIQGYLPVRTGVPSILYGTQY